MTALCAVLRRGSSGKADQHTRRGYWCRVLAWVIAQRAPPVGGIGISVVGQCGGAVVRLHRGCVGAACPGGRGPVRH